MTRDVIILLLFLTQILSTDNRYWYWIRFENFLSFQHEVKLKFNVVSSLICRIDNGKLFGANLKREKLNFTGYVKRYIIIFETVNLLSYFREHSSALSDNTVKYYVIVIAIVVVKQTIYS